MTSKHFIKTIYLCRPLPMKPPNFLIPPLLNWHFTTSILVSFNFHRIMKLKLFLKTEFIFYKKHVKSCFCLFGLTQSVKFLKFKKVLPLDFWWVFFCKIFSFLLKLTATWSKPWVKCSKPILNLSLAKPWNLQCNCLGIVREWNRNCSTMWTSLWMVLFKTKPMYGK